MIKYKDKIIEGYFIDPITSKITDSNGIIQETFLRKSGYMFWKGMPVHRIQAHTHINYFKGCDVHHIDEDPLNNNVNNLMVLTHAEHTAIHNKIDECSEETRKKLSLAAKNQEQTDYQKWVLATNGTGREWFNDGTNEVFDYECPQGFVKGRLNKSTKGKHPWNNGVRSCYAEICPRRWLD